MQLCLFSSIIQNPDASAGRISSRGKKLTYLGCARHSSCLRSDFYSIALCRFASWKRMSVVESDFLAVISCSFSHGI